MAFDKRALTDIAIFRKEVLRLLGGSSPGSPGSSLTQAEAQAAVGAAISAELERDAGAVNAQTVRATLAQNTAVFTASSHLALANTSATPLAGSSILCESVALFPQKDNGDDNTAATYVGVTASRQFVRITPGLTIGPFPGRKIDLANIQIKGAAGDGIEFWVVQ